MKSCVPKKTKGIQGPPEEDKQVSSTQYTS